MSQTSAPMRTAKLRGALQARHFLALALGSIVGSAWVVVMGDWLRLAGPGGAILGFIVGGCAIAAIGLCYAALAARFPAAGSELVYGYEVFGARVAFALGWFITLLLIAATAFEGIAIALLLEALVPGVLGPPLYSIGGYEIRVGSLLVGLGGTVCITWLNYRGVRTAARFQGIVTATFLGAALIIMATAFASGKVANLQPLFPSGDGSSWWRGALWIFATCPFWLNGFQAASQAIEERSPSVSLTRIAWIIVASILGGAVFYVLIVFAVGMAAPWQASAAQPMATAYAMRDLAPDGLLMRAVLITAIVSLVKTWNGIAFMAARMLLAQGRARFLPQGLARIHARYATPHVAVLAVGLLNAAGVLFGQGAIIPIVETAAMCVGFAYVVVCLAAWRTHGEVADKSVFRIPGGRVLIAVAMAAAVVMAVYGLLMPALESERGFPMQWGLLAAWSAIGAICWSLLARTRAELSHEEVRSRLLGSIAEQPARGASSRLRS